MFGGGNFKHLLIFSSFLPSLPEAAPSLPHYLYPVCCFRFLLSSRALFGMGNTVV